MQHIGLPLHLYIDTQVNKSTLIIGHIVIEEDCEQL